MFPRAAFRCAEGRFQVSLRSTGRGKRLLARRRLRRHIWSAVTRAALCAGRGTAFCATLPLYSRSKSGVARNTACHRTPNRLPGLQSICKGVEQKVTEYAFI